ncbi:hypothetical protein [Hymenobacter sp. B81]|uniref:hypothetical protein n=1 Tax=Hymenobacter sp. B81 TaxID=3344878 RepID=UPI0037DD0C70
MSEFLPLLLSLLLIGTAAAQPALIKDPGGYCNVRLAASGQAAVIDRLASGKIVLVLAKQAEGGWLPIAYQTGQQAQAGYVHQSRVAFLTGLAPFKPLTRTESQLKLQLDGLELTLTKARFSPQGRQIRYGKLPGEAAVVQTIDRTFPWGTDGNVPRQQYQGIQVGTGSSAWHFPVSAFRDVFEPNLELTAAYLDRATGTVYLEANNSDGAGGYVVVWAVKGRQIIAREVFFPF